MSANLGVILKEINDIQIEEVSWGVPDPAPDEVTNLPGLIPR